MSASLPKIALLGAGAWGMNHVKNFHALGALAAVVDPSPGAAERVAEAAPGIPVHANPASVFADDDIAGIVLATPVRHHVEGALAAIAAGKDLLVEKPMAMSVAEAERMASAAESADRILMVGHLLMYQPAVAWMRTAIENGRIGAVRHIETRRQKLGRVRDFENVWWSFAPHDLAVIHHLLGEPMLAGAQAAGSHGLPQKTEDFVTAAFRFETGATAQVNVSWLWPENLRGTTVIGDRGMMVYDEVAQKLSLHEIRFDPATLALERTGSEEIEIADDPPLRLECAHFLDCIATRRQPLSHGRHGVEVIRMLEEAAGSMAR